MISTKSVEAACNEVGEYTDERLTAEFDRFFHEQPPICEFIVELTHTSGQRVQEMSLFLSYVVFKAAEFEHPGVGLIDHEDLEKAYHDTESWMNQLGQAENTEMQATVAASLDKDTEPFLLQYIISELNEPMEDGIELNDEEKGEVFFVLKTIVAAIGQPKRRIIEIN
jgi:hypothetical protein